MATGRPTRFLLRKHLFRDEIYHSAFLPRPRNPADKAGEHRRAIQWKLCSLPGSHVSYPSLPYPLSAYTHGAEFARLLAERILILDGAMGTMIQQYKLSEMDFRGERFAEHFKDVKGNNELLTLVRPDIISEIHRSYLDAGADVIETNTFGATAIAQG